MAEGVSVNLGTATVQNSSSGVPARPGQIRVLEWPWLLDNEVWFFRVGKPVVKMLNLFVPPEIEATGQHGE